MALRKAISNRVNTAALAAALDSLLASKRVKLERVKRTWAGLSGPASCQVVVYSVVEQPKCKGPVGAA